MCGRFAQTNIINATLSPTSPNAKNDIGIPILPALGKVEAKTKLLFVSFAIFDRFAIPKPKTNITKLQLIDAVTIFTETFVGRLAFIIPSITRHGLKIYNKAGERKPKGLGRSF